MVGKSFIDENKLEVDLEGLKRFGLACREQGKEGVPGKRQD